MSETPQALVARTWSEHHPDLDLGPVEVFGRLRRLQEQHDAVVSPLYDGAPVSQGEVAVLIFLRHAEGPTIARKLAHQRGCSPAAMGKLLTKMERRELVSRRPNPADRRAVLVEITEVGTRLVDEYFPRQLALEVELLEGLSPQWRAGLVQALDQLSERLRRQA